MAKSEQPNLTEKQEADIERLMDAATVMSSFLQGEPNAWKSDTGNSISDMFVSLDLEPIAVALYIATMLEQMAEDEEQEEVNPLSYGAGYVAGLSVGIQLQRARQA